MAERDGTVRPSEKISESKSKAAALARRLAGKGYKLWEEGPCHHPQCGCVTEYEVRQFAPVLEKLYEALEASPKSTLDCQACREWREMRDTALALFGGTNV